MKLPWPWKRRKSILDDIGTWRPQPSKHHPLNNIHPNLDLQPTCTHNQPLIPLPIIDLTINYLCPLCGIIGTIYWQAEWNTLTKTEADITMRHAALQDIRANQQAFHPPH